MVIQRIGLVGAIAGIVLITPHLNGGPSPPYTHSLTSDRVNGAHSDFDTDLSPVEMGPMMVTLRTTRHRLEVLEHELAVGAVDERIDAARLTARCQGEADLVARIELAGVTSDLEDHVVLPLQEIEVSGLVEIYPQAGGLRLVTVENPENVEVRVESDLAGRLEMLCQGFAVMTLGSLDCEGFGRALSVIKVPLPEPGREFFVALSDLTPHERRQIEGYLKSR